MPNTPQQQTVKAAVQTLTNYKQARRVDEAEIPATPGIYAIHASLDAWNELDLLECPDRRPLYVGKSESSLARRDLKTHFATGKTGSSTLRRSLAGLLTNSLSLRSQPRNLDKPGHFANFALEPTGDEHLTDWMRAQLFIATFETPAHLVIDSVETDVIRLLAPPLNLAKNSTQWSHQVSRGRKQLADQARQWTA